MRVEREVRRDSVSRLRLLPDEQGRLGLDAATLGALRSEVQLVADDAECRALVLYGSEAGFCHGMDLDGVLDDVERFATLGVEAYAQTLIALRGASTLTVAVVDGSTLGGGVGLAAACDVLIASDRATFGLPEIVVNLLPAMVIPLLLERMPAQKARRWALGGGSIDAAQAAAWGLVDVVVPHDQLERGLKRELRALRRGAPDAGVRLKRHCDVAASVGWREGIAAGAACTAERLRRPDVLDAIRAFRAGELLPWFERPARGEAG